MNLVFLARQVLNVASTAIAHVNDDRVYFTMQLARRLPPPASRLVGNILSRIPRDASRAASAWLLGQESKAKALVSNSRTSSQLLGEIALNLGLLTEAELIAESVPGAASLKSRIHWTKGQLDEAIDVLPPSNRRTRLVDERLCLEERWWPTFVGHETARRSNAIKKEPEYSARLYSFPSTLHVLTNSLPHTRSGYAYRSQAILSTLQEAGHHVVAATRPSYPVAIGRVSSGPIETVGGVDYLRYIPIRPKLTPGARLNDQARWIAAQSQAHGTDILHTTTHFVNGLVTGAAAAATGLPWIYEVRGVLEETWAAAATTPAERASRRASQRFELVRAKEVEVASRANAVVTLGENMREHLIASGVRADAVTLIPNSVSEAVANADTTRPPSEMRTSLGLPKSGIWVGTAASIVGYEGLDVLVDAVKFARRAGTDLRLLIVGDGIALPELRQRANVLGENAIFTGRVPQAKAIDFQLSLDVVAVPRMDEPVCNLVTPIKPIEAMGLARPVVISNLPALRELVPVGAGEVVEPGDPRALAASLSELASDDEKRRRLGTAGREHVLATRRWKEIGRLYNELYSKLTKADAN